MLTRLMITAFSLAVLEIAAVAGPLEDAKAAYDRGYYSTALTLWRPLADQGDATAQENLGNMYANGRGVPKDDGEAVKWYRKAAEQSSASAQTNLAYMHANGRGVPKDYTQAFMWYRKAADQGFAEAQLSLGIMYSDGLGVSKDYGEALKWFLLAAAQGHIRAQYSLGVMYTNGLGVPQDYAEAYKWFRILYPKLPLGQDKDNVYRILDSLSKKMTREQFADAQKRADDWDRAHAAR